MDNFEYDTDMIDAINDDPNTLKTILAQLGDKLEGARGVVPETISTRDNKGTVRYPYKMSAKEHPHLAKALEEFRKNPAAFFVNNLEALDVYDAIEAFPSGIMVGDFSDIEGMKDETIDKAIGVRSTVYLKGEQYISFLTTLGDKLNENGMYLADCVRDNDGWYYRLAELLEFYNKLQERKAKGETDYDLHVYVIMGKGFPGEDFRQDRVPAALVITKEKDPQRYNAVDYETKIKAALKDGSELVPLSHLISEEGKRRYDIKRLDANGYTLFRLQEAQKRYARLEEPQLPLAA